MANFRTDRANTVLQGLLAELLPDYFQMERFGLLTVTRVEVARGMEHARVEVSALKNGHTFLKEMETKIRPIQKIIDKRLGIKPTPKLTFILDTSSALLEKIERL